MTDTKPWFWRVRGTKYMPAGWTGGVILLACLLSIIIGMNVAALNALSGQWMPVPFGIALAGLGLLSLMWACANRSLKHPRGRWRD
ncbi:MAG: hypothetical protein AAGI14_07890 [Pseudomonadota bacterium]